MRKLFSLLILTFSCFAAQEINIGKNTLILSATAESYLLADQVVLNFGVESSHQKLSFAKKMLTNKHNAILQALRELEELDGQEIDLEVSNISFSPLYDKDHPKKIIRYTAQSTIKVRSPLEFSSLIIEKAIEMGADRLYGLNTEPKKSLLEEKKQEALSKAAKKGIKEAKETLKSLGLRCTGIRFIQIDPYYNSFRPLMRTSSFSEKVDQNIDVTPQEKKIERRITLHISYEEQD